MPFRGSCGLVFGHAEGRVYRDGVAAWHSGRSRLTGERGRGRRRYRGVAERLVAIDASALIGLAKAGASDLLRGLFETITVTCIVRDEVLAGENLPGAQELTSGIEAGWVCLQNIEPDDGTFADLDAGESSTLALARASGAVFGGHGRAAWPVPAETLGIPVTGLAGILLQGKKEGLLDAVRPVLDELERNGFRLSSTVVEAVLKEAGE